MAFLTTSKTRAERYDAIVIGSGAAGGMAAYVLTKAGAKVLMLEAGRNYDPADRDADVSEPGRCAVARRLDAGKAERILRRHDRRLGGAGRTLRGAKAAARRGPRATVQNRMKTEQNFMWWRARMLGGRTNHYGRVHLRMGPRDFKPRSTDGLGFDWPITYEEVAPWYDKVDEFTGLYGSIEGLPNDPGQPALSSRRRSRAPTSCCSSAAGRSSASR